MFAILDQLRDCEVHRFNPGEIVIHQGGRTNRLYFLMEGEVEVLKDEVIVATASERGAVFGEMAILLDGAHTATVRATKPCAFYVVEHPRQFFESSPAICLYVCALLARRLDALNKYLIDVKGQFKGHDHIGMVDEVLESLVHRHPRDRTRPDESNLRRRELPN